MKKPNDWINQKVLITGGTSGLGKALAASLIESEAQVAIIARNRPQTLHRKMSFIQGDVSEVHDLHRIHAEALTLLGGVDVLINNASSLGPVPLRLLLDTDCEDLVKVLETNLMGPFRLTKLVLPAMILKGMGTIVNISSDAAIQAYPSWGAYCISKSALDHLTRIFHEELKGTGVRFHAIDPGDMDTPLHLAAIPDADRTRLHLPEESADRILKMILSGNTGDIRRKVR